MKSGERLIFVFENFRLDASKRLLFNADGEVEALMPKALDILLYLLQNAGDVVEKDELMSAIWPDTIVEENNLTQNISALRRVLGEKHRDNRFIATIPGRGYKFVAEVREVPEYAEPVQSAERHSVADGGADAPVSDGGQPRVLEREGKWYWPLGLGAILVVSLISIAILWTRAGVETEANNAIRSIAILPFKPLSAAERDESFELGMADTLISRFNGSDSITVRPLSAVRRFNSLDQDPIAAGKAVGVDAVLEGSIQSGGDRVRVVAKLYRVTDGKQIWTGQFDEPISDVFSLQDVISERVSAALRISLMNKGRKRLDTESVEAYQLYMKGNFHVSRLVLPEVQKGISYLEQAIAIDPNYALAYIGLANAYRAMVLTNDARPAEIMPKAKSAALKALEIDDTRAEAHNAVAVLAFWNDRDWRTAEKHHKLALEIDPDSAQSHFYYAHMLSNTGRHDEALAEIRRARELDPVSLVTNALEGQILTFSGKPDEALAILRATEEMDPNFWLAPLFMTRVYIIKKMYPEAIAAAKRAKDLTGGNAEATATIGFALARSGKADEARAVLKELEDKAATQYVPPYAPAQIYSALGDKGKALDLLEKAFDEQDVLMAFLKVDPKWNDIRSEPRFTALIEKMKL
jgi:DNA-binding winged helix-turn-helix (wHTH) protein/TolB-like protein/tetratricopeptide (TPR) repeat protein